MDLNEFLKDVDDAASCETKDEFVAFLRSLSTSYASNKKTWSNWTIDMFLTAIANNCDAAPGFRVGDPFEKDQKFIADMLSFIELKHRATNSVGSDNYYKELSSVRQKDSPWSILANIILSGKYYE